MPAIADTGSVTTRNRSNDQRQCGSCALGYALRTHGPAIAGVGNVEYPTGTTHSCVPESIRRSRGPSRHSAAIRRQSLIQRKAIRRMQAPMPRQSVDPVVGRTIANRLCAAVRRPFDSACTGSASTRCSAVQCSQGHPVRCAKYSQWHQSAYHQRY